MNQTGLLWRHIIYFGCLAQALCTWWCFRQGPFPMWTFWCPISASSSAPGILHFTVVCSRDKLLHLQLELKGANFIFFHEFFTFERSYLWKTNGQTMWEALHHLGAFKSKIKNWGTTCSQPQWILGIVACVTQGIRFRIIVVSPKSPIKQSLSVICLDFSCSGLEQLLFLRDPGDGRGAARGEINSILEFTFALPLPGLGGAGLGRAGWWKAEKG